MVWKSREDGDSNSSNVLENHGLQKAEKSEIAAAAALTFFCCHLQRRAVVGVCDVDVNQLA